MKIKGRSETYDLFTREHHDINSLETVRLYSMHG